LGGYLIGDTPLAQQYPSSYDIVQRKNVSIANVLNHTTLNIGFRMERFIKFMPMVNDDNPDKFVWKLTSTRLFNVKCMYLDLMNGHTRFLHKYLWELKITLKIKIFMWFLNKKMLVTKDNLAKQNWNGCKKSFFLTQWRP
jgi:hypothetical protein